MSNNDVTPQEENEMNLTGQGGSLPLSEDETRAYLAAHLKEIEFKRNWFWLPDFLRSKNLYDELGILQFEIVDLLASQIPEDRRTADLIQTVDVRSLVNSALASNEMKSGYQDSLNKLTEGYESALIDFIEEEYKKSSPLYPQGNPEEIARQQAIQLVQASRPNGTEIIETPLIEVTMQLNLMAEDSPAINEPPAPLTPTTASTVPVTDSSTASGFNPNASDYITRAAGASGDETIGVAAVNQNYTLSAQDIEFLFNLDSADAAISTYRQSNVTVDASGNAVRLTPGRLRIETGQEYGYLTPTRPELGGPVGTQPMRVSSTRTLDQTLLLPNKMSQQQIKNLTDRMREAGIFEMTGSEPTIVGDPTDPQFKRAWRQLIALSVQHGSPMTEILASSIEARQDFLNSQRQSFRANLTDPASIRLQTQVLAQNILGRGINDSEAESLVQMVHDWQRTSQLSQADPEATGDNIGVDWTARMEEYFKQQYPTEVEAKNIADTYDTFKSIITGQS